MHLTRWFNILDLKTKLLTGLVPIVAVGLVIAGVGYYGLHQTNTQAQEIYSTRLLPDLNQIQLRVVQLNQDAEADDNSSIANQLVDEIGKHQKAFHAHLKEVVARDRDTDRGQQLVEDIEAAEQTLIQETKKLLDATNSEALSTTQIATYKESIDALESSFADLQTHERNRAKLAEQETDAVYASVTWSLILTCLLGGLISAVFGFITVRGITTPVRRLDQAAQRVANGDLET